MQAYAPRVAGFANPTKNVGSLPLQPGMVIADLGSGSGHYVMAFALALAATGTVYAIDIQRDLLRRIKNEALSRGLRNIEIIHGDIGRLHGTKLADRCVDMALLSNVLFQLDDQHTALKEAWRIVKPKGHVAVIDWADSFSGLGPIKKHVLTRERALAFAHNTGLELVREFDAGAHHYGLLFKQTSFTNV